MVPLAGGGGGDAGGEVAPQFHYAAISNDAGLRHQWRCRFGEADGLQVTEGALHAIHSGAVSGQQRCFLAADQITTLRRRRQRRLNQPPSTSGCRSRLDALRRLTLFFPRSIWLRSPVHPPDLDSPLRRRRIIPAAYLAPCPASVTANAPRERCILPAPFCEARRQPKAPTLMVGAWSRFCWHRLKQATPSRSDISRRRSAFHYSSHQASLRHRGAAMTRHTPSVRTSACA